MGSLQVFLACGLRCTYLCSNAMVRVIFSILDFSLLRNPFPEFAPAWYFKLPHLPEPDGEEGRVLNEGEGEVEQVLEAGLLLFGVEEGKDVDGAQDEGEQELLAGRVAGRRSEIARGKLTGSSLLSYIFCQIYIFFSYARRKALAIFRGVIVYSLETLIIDRGISDNMIICAYTFVDKAKIFQLAGRYEQIFKRDAANLGLESGKFSEEH